MATSGTTDSTMTATQIMNAAAQELGYIGAGEVLSGEEYEDILPRLNFMLKSWQAEGVNLWREAEETVTFPAGTATLTLDPFCLDVLDARLVQSSTYQRPLQRWEIGEYNAVPNKAQQGFPSAFYVRKAATSVSLSLWPVPVQDMDVVYIYSRVIEDVTDGTQTLDVPQQWLETVWVNLAARCATMFGATRLDPAAAQFVQAKADALYQRMLDSDRPASVFLGSAYSRYF